LLKNQKKADLDSCPRPFFAQNDGVVSGQLRSQKPNFTHKSTSIYMKRFSYFTLFAIIFIAFSSFHKQAEKVKADFVLGHVDTVFSKELNEKRVLNIYLPEGYDPDSAARYPVIYLLDGSADEDFIHVAGLVQFHNFPWVNTLPPSIIVGIANVDRRRDFTFPTTIEQDKKDFPTAGNSANFIRFLEKELKPYINSAYKTNESSMIIGQSLAGLLATEILFTKPELFTQYVIVSPSLWWDNESLLKKAPAFASNNFSQKTEIYIGVGNEGKIMVRDAKQLYSLVSKNKQINTEVSFEYFGGNNHGNILHQAVNNAFLKFGEQKK
jgi:uncharacterized protein